ncbi:MAG: agmatinase [Candidatus Goldbacteria bacterium]|nr:agmatinase [Candidatus Goldiibacteriota bacterium]
MKLKSNIKFVGTSGNFKKSDLIICGIPYDITSTFRHGSQKAPDSIRKYSDSIETFSPIQEKDLIDYNIFDSGNIIFPSKIPKHAMKKIEKYTYDFINRNKRILYIGGEHLITLPIVKKYYEKYKDLKVIYFDAHADMRMHYDGNKFSHATVARRIVEMIGAKNIFMFGIRSFEKEEYNFIKKNKIFCDYGHSKFKFVIEKLKDSHVYISLDLDVFDPSCFPGVGNPEAGGIFFNDFIKLLPYISSIKQNIVSLDIVELMPDYDLSGNSSIFAAKIIRELILSLL